MSFDWRLRAAGIVVLGSLVGFVAGSLTAGGGEVIVRNPRARASASTVTRPSPASAVDGATSLAGPLSTTTLPPGTSAAAVEAPSVTSPPTPAPALDAAGACRPAPADLAAKAAYVVMPGVSARNLGEAEQLMARPKPPGGLFINDDITAATGPRLLALQSAGRLLIAIDEEGGRVQRIEKVYGSIPSAASQGPTTSDIERLGVDRGRQLQASGINMDFAPVVDLRRAASESVIGDRAYGDDARTVSERGGAFAAGLRNAGVIPTLKHFPGHGSAGDSHRGSVRSEPFDALRSSDLVPFSELSRAPGVAVMVGHLDVPGLTEPDTPASLSSAAYRLLRSEIGFDGLAVTDDLSGMLAVRNRMAAPEAGTLAVTAGADLALMQTSKYYDATVAAIVSAVEKGRLPESRLDEAVRRIRTVLACG